MEEKSVKKITFINLVWKFCERILAQLITTVVSVVLARILLPDDYGAIALISAFVNICNVFVVKGFGNSLIQKKDADELDFSTVFYINLAMTVVVYSFLYVAAPFVADYYQMPILSPLLRVMGLRIPCASVNSIQHSWVSRRLEFKKYFFATLTGTLLSAFVGIGMALSGFGPWALVGQYLSNTFVDTVFLWFTVKWRPKLLFSFSRAEQMFSYGWKLLAASLFDEFCNEVRSFAIGKKYSSADLAYYSKGNQFPALINTNIDASISSVLFPVLSKATDDPDKIKRYVRKSMKTSAFIMFPLLFGLAAVSRQFVLLFLTEKWLETVPYLQIMCAAYLFVPLQSSNHQAIKAIGRSDYFLGMNVIKNMLRIGILLITLRFGVKWIAIGAVFSTFCASIIFAFPNKKLLNYGYLEQFGDILPTMVLSFSMAALVYCIGFLDLPVFLLLILQCLSGAVYYILMSALFKFESFTLIMDTLKIHKNK